ncbi:MAG: hypothetical protein LKM37_02550 [Bacteroidales bacterium]|jgi:DNA polymerase-3 subunit delta'|nr:hypothetical protein [Bacteroidales bacterium]MCI1732913.1 hypothetical protein [Bacteroidales bacterium]
MKFSDLIGHKEIAANLKNMVDNDRIPHAILFAEKPGCGALPLVLSLLQYMFCKNKRWVAEQEGGGLFGAETSVGEGDTSTVNESAPDSCGICGGCKKMTDLVHPDVHFVFPINTSQLVEKGKKVSIDMYYGLFRELVKKNPYFSEQDLYRKLGLENKLGIIGVSEATWIINKLSFSAYEGGDKVVLMMFPERMNAEASNKLLKNIEEPSPGTFFFLITNDPGKIITTIRSRCRLVEVPPVDEESMTEGIIKNFKLDGATAKMWAECAQGSYGKAVELISQSDESAENYTNFINMLNLSIDKNLPDLLTLGNDMAAQGKEEQKAFFMNALELLREMYALKMNLPEIAYMNPVHKEELEKMSRNLDVDFFQICAEYFNDAISCIERNVNAKFVFCDLCDRLYLKV